ncbi:MAG: HAD-IA family hydrolase [Planctomycetes bacterium]|nr:HAD-IA family hydrolase [Planctomycetota bacterium]
MADYKAVFFDAVGTLIHPEPSATHVYFEVGRRFGTRHTPDEIAVRFLQAFRQQEDLDRTQAWRTSEERELRRWRDIVGYVFDDVTERDSCFAELYTHFAQPTSWRLDSALELLVERIQQPGLILGLASNYDSRLRSVLAGFPILAKFQHVVISSEIGYRKPAPEFFRRLTDLTKSSPDKILYVGDDPVSDFEAARAAGLDAMLIEKPAGLKALGEKLAGA